MHDLIYEWGAGGERHELRLKPVPGTRGQPFLFGDQPERVSVEVGDFYIGSTPVTQALWVYVTGNNPAKRPCLCCPVENVSWNEITERGGFLDQINSGDIRAALAAQAGQELKFRLPSETEWEYAARGGPSWKDGFMFSGSNDPFEVAWCARRWTGGDWQRVNKRIKLMRRLMGPHFEKPTHIQPVALKAPNQLGIYDMSGNVWEWCQDTCIDDLTQVPRDGTPYLDAGSEKRLRGGDYDNWDIHCTVYKRYGIEPAYHDGCLGFRLVLA